MEGVPRRGQRVKYQPGYKFEGTRLTVVKYAGRDSSGNTTYLFRCDCGTEKVLRAARVKSRETVSCGCYGAEQNRLKKPTNAKDLTDIRFGSLVAISRLPPRHPKHSYWLCRCDCGKEVEVRSDAFSKKNPTLSCGCLQIDSATIHGHTSNAVNRRSGTYKSWEAMMGRCFCPGDDSYDSYGAVGITVCERWRQFEHFLADMGIRPDQHEIDRIDGTKGYEPSNCKWSTRKQQARNRRTNVIIEFNGESKCLAEWEEQYGLPRGVISARLRIGWSAKDCITTPVGAKRRPRAA